MPIARFEMPDGRIARFEVPEGTTPEQAQEMIKGYDFNAPKANAQPNSLATDAKRMFGIESRQESPEVKRQYGLAARSISEGVSDIPTMTGDALNTLVNMVISKINESTGASIPTLPSATASREALLSDLPKPANSQERIVSDMGRAVAGAAPFVKAGQAIKGAEALATKPGIQAAAAASSAGASSYTREQGGTPAEQIIAGLGTGIAAPSVLEGVKQAGNTVVRGAQGIGQSFTRQGQEKIVGGALRRIANDKSKAISNLENTQEIVPGATQTTGEASKDFGLMAVERAVRSKYPAKFADAASRRNAARQQFLDSIAKTKEELNQAIQSRDSTATPLREQAFSNRKAVDVSPIMQKADEVLSGPTGAKDSVRSAMKWVVDRIDGESDPQRLYGIRQDINDLLAGKYGGDKAGLKLASKELMAVRDVIDDQIESGAPGFKNYLSTYKEMSRPINQMETAQGIKETAGLAAPDITTSQNVLSQAKFKKAVADLKSDKLNPFTKQQMQIIEKVAADLDSGAAVTNSLIRPSGSDTFQNLTTAHILGNMLGRETVPDNVLTRALGKPVGWITRKLSADEVDELMADALLDPKMAASLMKKASPKHLSTVGEALKKRAISMGLGTAYATGSGVQPQPKEE